jgi:hypothetical protein
MGWAGVSPGELLATEMGAGTALATTEHEVFQALLPSHGPSADWISAECQCLPGFDLC